VTVCGIGTAACAPGFTRCDEALWGRDKPFRDASADEPFEVGLVLAAEFEFPAVVERQEIFAVAMRAQRARSSDAISIGTVIARFAS